MKYFKELLIAIFSFLLGIVLVLVYERFQPARNLLVGPSVEPSPSFDIGLTPESLPSDFLLVPEITNQDLQRGWYWGGQDQKKSNTPDNWIFTESGRSSCWHQQNLSCLNQ